MKKIEIIKKKWLKDTFLTILLVVIIFTMYFFINYGIKKLNLEDIDLTTDKIYSISDDTTEKLEDLDEDVKIILINMSDYAYLTDFTNKYTQLNSHIKVEKIDDLTQRPDIMSEYEIEATENLIIVESDKAETYISLNDLYTYDYTTGEQIDTTEEQITNAIIEVTLEDKPLVYFLEGHNYYDDSYFQLVKQDITSESNEIENLNILTKGSIPEDCSCLLITTLKEDITEMEKDAIIDYSSKGGKILLLANGNISGINTPNFDEILNLYGFNLSTGILMEQDSDKMLYNSPEFILSTVDSSILSKNTKMNMNLCLIGASQIKFKDEADLENLGITYSTIAETSSEAFLRNNFNITSSSKTNQDIDAGDSIVGALVTRSLEDGNSAEMIVYSNAIFATNQKVNIGNNYAMYANKLCNNDDIVNVSISYLTKRTDTITIRKDSDSVSYTVTQKEHNVIVGIIFLVPALIIICGIIVWQIRRRKK